MHLISRFYCGIADYVLNHLLCSASIDVVACVILLVDGRGYHIYHPCCFCLLFLWHKTLVPEFNLFRGPLKKCLNYLAIISFMCFYEFKEVLFIVLKTIILKNTQNFQNNSFSDLAVIRLFSVFRYCDISWKSVVFGVPLSWYRTEFAADCWSYSGLAAVRNNISTRKKTHHIAFWEIRCTLTASEVE